MPLRTATVIPSGWAEHHLSVAEASMTARVELYRADDDRTNDRAGFDPKRKRVPGAPEPAAAGDMVLIYSGPALVTAQTSQAANADVAMENITVRSYAVSLPRAAPRPRAGQDGTGDRLVVLASPGDPGLVGAKMRVIDVAVASESFARDVICLYELNRNNPPLAKASDAVPPTPPAGG